MASSSKGGAFPLTTFLCNMMKATNEQVLKAAENPEKMARHYGIRLQDCKDYLRNELIMRGMYNERAAEIVGK